MTDIQSREKLKEVAELKKITTLSKTIPASLLQEAKEHGWVEEKKPGRSTNRSPKRNSASNASLVVMKSKPYGLQIADRVWSLLYNMEFSSMSPGEPFQLQGTTIYFRQKLDIDIVSVDSEVGLGVFLQASLEPREADTCLLKDLDLYKKAGQAFKQAINDFKPHAQPHALSHAFILFLCGVTIDDEARKLAKDNQVAIFNEQDLDYYEDLVQRLQSAARYQFLAEVFEKREIPSLKIEVPAIQLRAGSKYTYYVFAIRPDMLMKISFIAHHKPGKPADINTYQRIANKERLEEMREYVKDAGIYPTNIVVSLNIPPDFNRFPGQQKAQSLGAYHSELGTLTLSNSYKSAWIIDGQHRLFSYASEKRASTTSIIVIAFVGLSPKEQTKFFFDINSKQAHIDELHLTELQKQIFEDASNPGELLLSLIPQAIDGLDKQPDSPFYQRIHLPGASKSKKRSISSATLNELLCDDLFTTLEYGVFYVKNDANATLERIMFLLNSWFTLLQQDVKNWWDGGNNRGAGGLSIDHSVHILVLVLQEVLAYLIHQRHHHSLSALSTQEVATLLRPYASSISTYLSTFSETQRQEYRKDCGTKKGRVQLVETFLGVLQKEGLLPS